MVTSAPGQQAATKWTGSLPARSDALAGSPARRTAGVSVADRRILPSHVSLATEPTRKGTAWGRPSGRPQRFLHAWGVPCSARDPSATLCT